MTGKEFFGKLLSNRQDQPEPWDREDSGDSLSTTKLDIAAREEEDEIYATGGDGLSSSLPEVRPSVPYPSSDEGVHEEAYPSNPDELLQREAETPRSYYALEDNPDVQLEPIGIGDWDDGVDDSSIGYSAEAASHAVPFRPNGGFPDEEHLEQPTNESIPDAEILHAASNGGHAEAEIPKAPSVECHDVEVPRAPANGAHVDVEIPTAPSPTNGKDTASEIPEAPANGRLGEGDAAAAPTDLPLADSDLPVNPQSPTDRRSGAEDETSPSMASDPVIDSESSEAPSSISVPSPASGERVDINPAAATASNTGRQAGAAAAAAQATNNGSSTVVGTAPTSNNGRQAESGTATELNSGRRAEAGTAPASTNGKRAEAGTAPASTNGKRAEAGTAPVSNNGRHSATESPAAPIRTNLDDARPVNGGPTQDAPSPRPRQPQSGPTSEAPARGRKEAAEPARTKSKPPAVQGDAELRGIKDRVVNRLLEKKLVSEAHVKAAIRERNKDNLKATLWRIVAYQHGVDREAIYREAALTYAFVERKLSEKDVDLEFVRQVADVFPEKRRNRLIELRVVPVGYEFEQQTQMLRVVFLTHDPSLPAVRELMQELNLERYELQYASETVVKDLLAKAFPRKNEYLERMSEDPLAYDLGMSYEEEKGELIDEEALEAEINRSSLINLFEAALVESVHKGASDIHIYPNAKRQVEIHFRVDGRLFLWHLEDKVHPESLLAVIKDKTMNVDRFERDMAQDGFIQRKVDDTIIRYRVSILPIATAQQGLHAESIVIRVLDDRKVIANLSQLGLLKGALERFDMAIRQPHGMVILTGPTGSGKSTTLVAALHQVITPEINVLTVEDPVEYIIPGVRQIKLNHKLNLEQALRSILRHDPDVVMVGEMRDRQTAELAIKLANTGHLTFSTLHTNDAPSAVSRLYKMGVEPFLIAYAINLIVAQRLIRSLCPTCKVTETDPDPVLLDRLGFTKADLAATTLYKASGDPTCKTCKGTGYKGRRAISEALYFSRAIRHMIVEADSKIDEDGLREAARKEGMLTLQDSAREVVKMGVTSVEEMMRVTTTEE